MGRALIHTSPRDICLDLSVCGKLWFFCPVIPVPPTALVYMGLVPYLKVSNNTMWNQSSNFG